MSGLIERLERHADWIENPTIDMDAAPKMKATLREAAALLDRYEKALEAADELADSITDEVLSGASWTGVLKAAIAYRSARATSTKEDG